MLKYAFVCAVAVGLAVAQPALATASTASPQPKPVTQGSTYAGLTYQQVKPFLKPDGRGGEGGWIPQADVTRLTAGQVQPLTASACNISVCNKVTGTGTYVSQWETTAYGNVGCSEPHFESFTRQYLGYRICPSQPGDGVYFYVYKKALNYANNDLLCNEWLNARVYGEPCIRIIA